MTKQELLKQADYTFQRGNRELAKKYLSEYLASYPDDEVAWMLMAKITGDHEHQIACYERVLKLNPNNNEARIGLTRIQTAVNPALSKTVARDKASVRQQPHKNVVRGVLAGVLIVVLLGTTTLVVARNNPSSKVAQMLVMATPTLQASNLAKDVAPETRAEVLDKYPQYAPVLDALISFAVSNAQNGMEGAPERPGDEIIVSDQSGAEAKIMLERSVPQPGSLSSITVTEQQITSWLAMEMKSKPDLPLSDVQVYLRDGQIQVWGIVSGGENQTSALITGEVQIDASKRPAFIIESMQVGQQVIPDFVVSQMETWLNQALLESIDKSAPGLELMNVKVANGLLIISGMR
ncbi:MAG TPA: hypothetical protein PKL78_02965 [Anaerolineales bacterium]|nr:hypothetical protein [Anaerolineales bacterium]HNN12491.1 hypothetical protein [Anaerolineales bacterium]HNO31044.1 hypothetical protein [Anaerolineales bacterium]